MLFKGWVRGRKGASEELILTHRVSDIGWDLKRGSADLTPGGQVRSHVGGGERPIAN